MPVSRRQPDVRTELDHDAGRVTQTREHNNERGE
jgi:hypothetical protein